MADLMAPPIRTALMNNPDGTPLNQIPPANPSAQGQISTEKSWYYYWRDAGRQINANTKTLTGIILYGPHADRPDPATVPNAALYVESDRSGVLYQSQGGEWHFLAGTMWGTIVPDNRPTDLGVDDAGFDYRTTDEPPRQWIWSGFEWIETTSTGMVEHGLHSARPPTSTVPDGAFYSETDRGVVYQNWAGTWIYVTGTMWGSLSPNQRPTDLGVHDGGFQYRTTDANPDLAPRTFTWSQTEWVETTGNLYGTHAGRPAANEKTPPRTIYVETDRSGVIYQQQANAWHFLAGAMWGTILPDNRPTDLGVNDAGFTYRTTDPPPRSFVWSGTAWVETTPNSSAQAQTPWQQDIDGAQHNLSNVASIEINRTGGNSVLSITSDATDAPFVVYARGPQTWWVGPGIEATGDFIFYNQTASTVVMDVAANGNVGIGGTLTVGNLVVNGQFSVHEGTDQYLFFVSQSGITSIVALNDALNAHVPLEYVASAHYFIGGNVGIGTASPAAVLDVNGVMRCIGATAPTTGAGVEISYVSGGGFVSSYDRAAAAYHPLLIGGNPIELFGGNVGINVNSPTHQLQLSTDDAWKTATSTWGFPSGAGVKQNVKDLPGGLDVINRIRPIEAEYNGEHKTPKGQRVVSVIAEEIREVLPHTVTEDSEGVLGFNPHEIIFQLILAVKQLSKEVDEWKRRFN